MSNPASSLTRAGALGAGVILTLLVAACGGGSSPATGGSTTYHKSVAFAQCMRSHGEPNWPDPSSNGTFNDSQININSPQYHSAVGACGSLLPPGVQPIQLSAKQLRQRLDQALKFAICMRAHGLAKYPDPTLQTIENGQNGSLEGTGVPPNSPQFQSALKSCRSDEPSSG